MGKRIVVALGGNALGNTPYEQLSLVETTASTIVDLVEEGHEVVVGHGNGPQVGMINLAFEVSSKEGNTSDMPFPECGAMSQGYIGYHLQQSIQKELRKRKMNKDCATVVTQVVVDKEDEGFQNPTKPIGSFMSKEEAEKMEKEKGYTFVEDAGRGYRRVVPSPIPKKIVELNVVEKLVQENTIVITVGGGGIPVIETEEGYQGVAAVIDKDRSSALLAKELKADMLMILTAVDRVCIHYNTPQQKELPSLSVLEAKSYMGQNEFAKGSMLPKIEACVDFVEETKGEALITSLTKAKEALQGKTGTIIHP